jgi:hypothetical protein
MKNLLAILKIAHQAGINLALWGTHGVGKTQGVRQFVDELEEVTGNAGFLEPIILSQIDPLVLGGYPGREQLENGEYIETFAKPEWIQRLQDAAAKGLSTVLFLDEFNRADRFAHNAAMSLVLDKEINGHKLPKDCFIVVAMNPETKGDMGVNELTDPMIDRFCHVAINSDAGSWLNWADETGVNSYVSGYIRKTKNKLNHFELDFDKAVGDRIKPTPRSWAGVGLVVDALANDEGQVDLPTLNTVGIELLKGLVGLAEASALVTHIQDNYQQLFTYDEIVKGNKKTITRVQSLVKDKQTQVLVASLEAFHKEGAKKGVTVDDLLKGGFVDFITNCPVDVQSSFWSISEDSEFWSGIIVDMPVEVCAAMA